MNEKNKKIRLCCVLFKIVCFFCFLFCFVFGGLIESVIVILVFFLFSFFVFYLFFVGWFEIYVKRKVKCAYDNVLYFSKFFVFCFRLYCMCEFDSCVCVCLCVRCDITVTFELDFQRKEQMLIERSKDQR